MDTGIDCVVAAANTKTALAAALGVSKGAVSQWNAVPVEHCAEIERKFGVPVEQIRPDLFWVRIADSSWPHPKGRPALDLSFKAEKAAA
jgi:DNA-binding transcriptional regulator YdaS (Cro superfamily)